MTTVTLSAGSTTWSGRLLDTGDSWSVRSGAGAVTWRTTGGTRVRFPAARPAATRSITVDVESADVARVLTMLRGPSLVHVAATGPGISLAEDAIIQSVSSSMVDYDGGRRITVTYEVNE